MPPLSPLSQERGYRLRLGIRLQSKHHAHSRVYMSNALQRDLHAM